MKCIRMRKGVIRVYSSLSSSVLSSSMAEWNVSWARSKWMVPVKNVAEACANRMSTEGTFIPCGGGVFGGLFHEGGGAGRVLHIIEGGVVGGKGIMDEGTGFGAVSLRFCHCAS